MSLDVSVKHRFPDFELSAAFQAPIGVTVLFGPSGSGKTSILKMIAGLISPIEGKIKLNGDVIFSSKTHRSIKPHQRHFGYIFQEPRLFPHYSVRGNLLYGAKTQGKQVSDAEFERIVDLLGIEPLLYRNPLTLSGGEQQRVAIGRVLLTSPKVLLMDEPLSSLDQHRKLELLPFIEEICGSSNLPIVYVTHSMNEVLRLADQVVQLHEGKVQAILPPDQLYQSAAYLASVERNDLGSIIEGHVMSRDDRSGVVTVKLNSGELSVPLSNAEIGNKVRLFIPAKDVLLALNEPVGLSAQNILQASITMIDSSHSPYCTVTLDCGGVTIFAQITCNSVERLGLVVGMPIYAIIKAVVVDAF